MSKCPHLDRILGLDERITRRDFLDGAPIASEGMLLAAACPFPLLAQAPGTSAANWAGWTGYSGEGDYKGSAGNTEQVVENAHEVRDKKFDQVPSEVTETGEIYDCVIVGGGFSGLSAGLFFHQRAGSNRNCLILDNARIFGGVAKRNEFIVDGHRLLAPQASVHFQPPYPNSFLKHVYDAIGLDWEAFKAYQKWQGRSPEISLPRSPYGVGHVHGKPAEAFFFGAKFGQKPGIWITDPWGKTLDGAPFSDSIRKDLLALHGDHTVVPPLVYDYPGDAISRQLDSMTIEHYLVRTYGVSREAIRLLVTPETSGGFGLGPDVLSAFLQYEWSKVIPTVDDSMETGLQMFPGGNSGMIRLFVKTLIPASIEGPRTMAAVHNNPVNFAALDQPDQPVRIRLESTAVRVEHMGEPSKADFVSVMYLKGGKIFRVKAKTVVMAGGGWMAKHVVRDLDESRRRSYDQFFYSPYMTANVAVRNWRFLYDLGISSAAWFEGFGRYVNVRKQALFGVDLPEVGPDLPTVLTFFVDFAKPGLPAPQQGSLGRAEILSTPFADYERQIREQMMEMFAASGFEAKRDIAGIVLNRFGHAFINPQPGFFFGLDGKPAPRDALRNGPFGRIAFSHADLAGAMDHRNGFIESDRAVNQLLDRVLT
ncbi:MAG: FAD-dependent oxidoreductase [Acidobacteria bacterium]|nr:MAG: FAD-dependent oxidoreductase [Acidobacteriota bacterium]